MQLGELGRGTGEHRTQEGRESQKQGNMEQEGLPRTCCLLSSAHSPPILSPIPHANLLVVPKHTELFVSSGPLYHSYPRYPHHALCMHLTSATRSVPNHLI